MILVSPSHSRRLPLALSYQRRRAHIDNQEARAHAVGGPQTQILHPRTRIIPLFFLFPSIQSADITNSPRVRLLLNWRLDPEGAIFSGSRTTGSYAAHASSSLSVIL